MIPKNSVMLLSYVNTQLRNKYSSLNEFCNDNNVAENEIRKQLEKINYNYSEEVNQFI